MARCRVGSLGVTKFGGAWETLGRSFATPAPPDAWPPWGSRHPAHVMPPCLALLCFHGGVGALFACVGGAGERAAGRQLRLAAAHPRGQSPGCTGTGAFARAPLAAEHMHGSLRCDAQCQGAPEPPACGGAPWHGGEAFPCVDGWFEPPPPCPNPPPPPLPTAHGSLCGVFRCVCSVVKKRAEVAELKKQFLKSEDDLKALQVCGRRRTT